VPGIGRPWLAKPSRNGQPRRDVALHLTGPALWWFETSRSLTPARQVNAVVSRKEVRHGLWRFTLFCPSCPAFMDGTHPQRFANGDDG